MPHTAFCPSPRDTSVPAPGPPTPPATVVMSPVSAADRTPALPACAGPPPHASAAADADATSASTQVTAAGRPSPPDRALLASTPPPHPIFMTRSPQRFSTNPADGYAAN